MIKTTPSVGLLFMPFSRHTLVAMTVFPLFAFLVSACATVGNAPESASTGSTVINPSFDEVIALSFAPPASTVAYGDDTLQYSLLWEPGVAPRATLFFIHGGCWLNAYDVNHARALASALARDGFRVVAVEYRRVGDEGGGWPGSFDDASSALVQVAGQTQEPLVVLGHSAGGHLALLLASRRPDLVHAAIGLAAITDLESYARGENSCETATPQFMGGTPQEQPDVYSQATLVNKAFSVPVSLLQGLKDPIVPVSHTRLNGASTRLVEDAGHFDWLHPQAEAYAVLLDELSKALGSL
ncbi:MAG: alpha/beta fold hydrolase [Pseudomonadota bacterium]